VLDKDAVQHVAKLARLRLTEAEAATFATQLSSILGAFEEISKLDSAGIEALATPTQMAQYLRADVAESSATADEILANAPERSGHLFKVPPVV
jgi:aspartyl-tRNA(Asn)/glutamyl-tRNA(Gln) amidotransferase subunit C